MTFTRILCPIDFSDTSRRALEYAVSFATWHRARLTVMHVAPSFDPVVTASPQLGAPAQVVFPVREEDVLGRLREEAAAAGFPKAEAVAETGDPSRAILEAALSRPADLIVVGTHGRSGVERTLLGSVAERVVHKAPCPVLTVPPSAHSPGKRRPRSLLCAVDFSPASLQALGYAAQLAIDLKAALVLLHVVEWPFEDDRPLPPDSPLARRRQELLDEAAERLERLAPKASVPGLTHVVVTGHVKDEISRRADDTGADLVVMGAQARSGLGLTLLGSTTERVIRRAACPVLTLRTTELTPREAILDR